MSADDVAGGGVLRTVLLDVAANLLCVAVVLLAVLSGRDAPSPPATSAPLMRDAAPDAGDTIDALLARASRSDRVTLDLEGGEVRLVRAGALPQGAVTLDAASRALPRLLARALADAPGPAELFVFDHAGHAALRAALGDAALREHDVPLALRAPAGGWSPRFRALWGRGLTPDAFRERLADVLRGGGEASGRPPPTSAASTSGLSLRSEMVLVARALALGLALWALGAIGRRFRPPVVPGRAGA